MLKPEAPATPKEYRASAANSAAYKAPPALQFVADLPKTSTGKIMLRELRKLDA